MISLLVTSPKKIYKQNLPWIKAKTKSFIHNTKIINNINNRIVGAIYLEVGIWVGPDGPEWAGPKFRRAGP